MSNSFISESSSNQSCNAKNILIVVNSENESVDERTLISLTRKQNLSVVQLCEEQSSRKSFMMDGSGTSNFFSSIDQEELFKIEQALTSEQAKQILGDSLNGILDESEEPAVLEYLAANDSEVEGDDGVETEELSSANVDLGLLQLITMDHCYSAAPFHQLAVDFEGIGISDVHEEVVHEYEEVLESYSPHSDHHIDDQGSPPSPRRRSQRQVDKAEKEQLEKIRAENTELLRKEKVMKQQGGSVSGEALGDGSSVVSTTPVAPKRRTRKSTTSSRPDSSASIVSNKSINKHEDEMVDEEAEVEASDEEPEDEEMAEEDSSEEEADTKKTPRRKKPPSSPKPKPEPKKRTPKPKVVKPKVEKPSPAPPAPPIPEAPPAPKEGDMPTVIPESKVKTLRNLKEVEALHTGFIAVGARKAGPDVKAVIEKLHMKEPEKKAAHTPVTPVTDEKKYPKRERKIPAYLREMEVGPALFSTPDVIKPKGMHGEEEKREESPLKPKSEIKHPKKHHPHEEKEKHEKKVKKEVKKEHKEEKVEEKSEEEEDRSGSESDWESEDDPDKLWCICQRPHNNRFMICCDKCEEWFHGNCVGVTRALGKEMEERGQEWVCPQCKKTIKKRQRDEADEALKKQEEEKKKKQQQQQQQATAQGSNGPPVKQQKSQEQTKNRDIRNFLVPEPKPKVKAEESPIKNVKCIIKSCSSQARPQSVYCSDACIIKHAQESLQLLDSPAKSGERASKNEDDEEEAIFCFSDQEDPEIPSSDTQNNPPTVRTYPGTTQKAQKTAQAKPSPTTPAHLKAGPRKIVILAEAPPPPPKPSPLRGSDLRVPVFERETGSLLKGAQAPRASELERFLQSHPTYEVFRPGETQPTKFYGQNKPQRVEKPLKRQDNNETPKREKVQRRVSTEKPKEVPREDPGEAIRQTRNAVKKFFVDALVARKAKASDIKITDEEVTVLSNAIEDELYGFFGDTGMKYKSRYRSLIFNIKDLKNEGLFRKILTKELGPEKLVRMPAEELASAELAQWRQRETQHQLEMIIQTENELLALGDRRLVKTHKGEEMIEKADNKEYNAGVPEESVVFDPTALHSTHVYDLNCLLCTGKMTEKEYSEKKEKELKSRSKKSSSSSRDKKNKHRGGSSRERSRSHRHESDRDKRHKRDRKRSESERKVDGDRKHGSQSDRKSESDRKHVRDSDRKRHESDTDRKRHDSDDRKRKHRDSERDDRKRIDKKDEKPVDAEKTVKVEAEPSGTENGSPSSKELEPESVKAEVEMELESQRILSGSAITEHGNLIKVGTDIVKSETSIGETPDSDLKDKPDDARKHHESGKHRDSHPRHRDSDRKRKRRSRSRDRESDRKKTSDDKMSSIGDESSQVTIPDSTPISEIFEDIEIPSFTSDDLLPTENVSSSLTPLLKTDTEEPVSQVVPVTPDADKEISSTIKTPDWSAFSPARQPVQVWKGSVTVSDYGKFHAVGMEVSNNCEFLQREVKSSLGVVGRIRPLQVESYLNEVKKSASRDVLVIRFACQPQDQQIYESIYKHLIEKDRYGVLGPLPKTLKDFYLIPLPSNKNVPEMLLPIEGPGFEEPRPDLLIGVIVRVKGKQKTPRHTKGATPDDGSDTMSPISLAQERPHYNPSHSIRKHTSDISRSPSLITSPPPALRHPDVHLKRPAEDVTYIGTQSRPVSKSVSSEVEEIEKQIELEKKKVLSYTGSVDTTEFSIPGLGGHSDFPGFGSSAESSLAFLSSATESKKPRLHNELGDVDMRAYGDVDMRAVLPVAVAAPLPPEPVAVVPTRPKDPRQRNQPAPASSLRSLSDEELVRRAMEMEQATFLPPVAQPVPFGVFPMPPPPGFVQQQPGVFSYPSTTTTLLECDIPLPPPPPSIRGNPRS